MKKERLAMVATNPAVNKLLLKSGSQKVTYIFTSKRECSQLMHLF